MNEIQLLEDSKNIFLYDWNKSHKEGRNAYICQKCTSNNIPHEVEITECKCEDFRCWIGIVPSLKYKCTGCGQEKGPVIGR